MNKSKKITWAMAALPLLLGLFAFRTWTLEEQPAGDGPPDHAALIRNWDDEALQRGKAIYADNCAQCHGEKSVQPANPNAAVFARDTLQRGSDPYSMWQTLTNGYGRMPAQSWLSPRQRYDVIHYIREAFFKESNPSQYTPVTHDYLTQLPDPDSAQTQEQRPPMDYGPALAYELEDARSALILPLADSVHLYYDLHTMSIPKAWAGGFLNLSQSHHVEYKGNERARIAGRPLGLGPLEWGHEGSFADPRRAAETLGPMPEDRVEYLGHYLHGDQAVLSYTVSGRTVLDRPGYRRRGDFRALTHALRIGPGEAVTLSLGRRANPERAYRWALSGPQQTGSQQRAAAGPAPGHLLVAGTDTLVAAGVAGAPKDTRWEMGPGGRLLLHVPARSEPTLLKVFRGTRPAGQAAGPLADLVSTADITDPARLTAGGPRRWNETLTTTGAPGGDKGAYVLDSLGIPFENPWGSWMRLAALDFFEDGRAAVSTLNGDVWVVSGIDASLSRLTWQRFATGLYEPLGLKIVDDTIYVQGRDRLTRLHDQNGDGEADFYESFFAFDYVSRGYHAFTFGLDTDSQGRFYTAVSGRKTAIPIPGYVLRIGPDGERSEVMATGFRHPNGLTVDSEDRLFVSDNQGGWMPASKLSYVKDGGFYGYVGWENKRPHGDFHRPVFWLPQAMDNSSGGPLWVESERWGPLSGRLLHTSYGAGRVFYTSLQEVGGVLQGSAVRFPWPFSSGVMRARVNPKDGQVYVVGQKGWGTRAQQDGAFDRIRYTGRPASLPLGASTTPDGIRLQFSAPLKAKAAVDPSRYTLKRWDYKWTSNYGSSHYRPGSHRSLEGEEVVQPEAIRLSEDRRAVTLSIPDHQPVDQMQVGVDLEAQDGTPIQETLYLTIKQIPGGGSRVAQQPSGEAP